MSILLYSKNNNNRFTIITTRFEITGFIAELDKSPALHIKQKQKRELNDMKVRVVHIQSQIDRDTKILTSRCDLCNDEITEAPQDFE